MHLQVESKKIFAALLTLFIFTLCGGGGRSCAQASRTPLPAPREGTQIWSDVQIAVPLNERIDFVLLGTLRLGRNVTNFVDERAGASFSFKAGKYLTFSPGYLYIATQPTAGRKSYENRLSFATTARFALGSFTLSDRNLFERRIRRPQADSTRYRNRFQLEHPINPGGLKMLLFVSDEVFYDLSINEWVRNRFSAGIGRKFNKHYASDFYYLRQSDGRALPGDLNVFGTVLRIRL